MSKQTKNQKYGRNSRAASNTRQELRTNANKQRRVLKFGVQKAPFYPKAERTTPKQFATYTGLVPDYRTHVRIANAQGYVETKPPVWVIKNGVTTDVYPAQWSEAHVRAMQADILRRRA